MNLWRSSKVLPRSVRYKSVTCTRFVPKTSYRLIASPLYTSFLLCIAYDCCGCDLSLAPAAILRGLGLEGFYRPGTPIIPDHFELRCLSSNCSPSDDDKFGRVVCPNRIPYYLRNNVSYLHETIIQIHMKL